MFLLPALTVVTLHHITSYSSKMSGFQLNFLALKEPLGFIKVLEWVSCEGSRACVSGGGRRHLAPEVNRDEGEGRSSCTRVKDRVSSLWGPL